MRIIIKSAGRCGSHYLQEYMSNALNYTMEEINYGKYSNTCTLEHFKHIDTANNVVVHNHFGFIPTDPSKWRVIYITRDDLLERAISVWFTRYTKQNNINVHKVEKIKKLATRSYKIKTSEISDIIEGIKYVEDDIEKEIDEHNWVHTYKLNYKEFINNPLYISDVLQIPLIDFEQKKYMPSLFSVRNVINYNVLKEKFDKR